jgi:hypothetical protein
MKLSKFKVMNEISKKLRDRDILQNLGLCCFLATKNVKRVKKKKKTINHIFIIF